MPAFFKNQNVVCNNNDRSVGGLKLQPYQIADVSYMGYIWLKEPMHASGRIGPYCPTRFTPTE